MKKLHFAKMHGNGNDFILINYNDLLDSNIKLTKKIIEDMCDRHFGIGADGLLLLSDGKKYDYKYVMYNQDGSQAEMCGNGLRCFMKYLFDKGMLLSNNIIVETGAGILNLGIDGNVITIDMGKPSRIKNLVYKTKNLGDRFPLKIDKDEFIFTPISMGNPHAVIFCRDVDVCGGKLENLKIEKFGKKIENNVDIFPNKTNVEFVKVLSSTEILMRVWERGVGETLACGTGACASVVAGILSGRLEKNKFIKVNLLGGIVEIKWSGHLDDSVIMKGGANFVYEGYYNID